MASAKTNVTLATRARICLPSRFVHQSLGSCRHQKCVRSHCFEFDGDAEPRLSKRVSDVLDGFFVAHLEDRLLFTDVVWVDLARVDREDYSCTILGLQSKVSSGASAGQVQSSWFHARATLEANFRRPRRRRG